MISRKSFLETRLVCRRMSSLIDENRAILEPMFRKIVVAQHDYFAESPKRFVVADPSKLPLALDSCHHAEIWLLLFFKVSLESYKVEEITQSVRKNHIKIHKMVFYGVYLAACEAHLVIQLLKTSGVACLLMAECKLTRNLEEIFQQHGHSRVGFL
ncbi:unnamed protein product [Cylicocyclus nassatus]|uniref:Uncharacterized protein n=1 Tax=Cylicocyclus nassatus TaxID=53992 RepID=A0AA36M0M4_CYLNA|nr:unnamed protein product [Cylicocyclus nassatus]